MCDDSLLPKLKHLQITPTELICTSNSQCWCNKVSYRFSHLQSFDGCMSPKEMCELGGNDLTEQDKKYLQSLFNKKFNPIS